MFVKRSSVYLITASEKQSSTEGYGNQNTEEKAESSLCRAWIIPPKKTDDSTFWCYYIKFKSCILFGELT